MMISDSGLFLGHPINLQSSSKTISICVKFELRVST